MSNPPPEKNSFDHPRQLNRNLNAGVPPPPTTPHGSYIDVLSRCVQRNYNTTRAIVKSARGLVFLIFSFDLEIAIYYRYVSVTSYMIVYTGDTE